MIAALIPAAGEGRRLGRGPKAFVRLGGRTLLEHAVALFDGIADEIVVALPPGREAEGARLVPTARVLAGGRDRQATVAMLVAATRAETVLVHDAARPLAPAWLARDVAAAARAHGAATAGLVPADTLHDLDRDAPVPRDALRAVQTPQGFTRALLARAHEGARERGLVATDDAQLVRESGHPVAWVDGSPWAHKVTVPDDLAFLEALLAGGRVSDAEVAP